MEKYFTHKCKEVMQIMSLKEDNGKLIAIYQCLNIACRGYKVEKRFIYNKY